MKTKLLLIYGYVIPILTSVLFSVLPWLTGIIRYEDISVYFSNHSEVLFGFLAVIGAITFPFQSSILNEDNPYVLSVLGETNVRSVFIRASVIQAMVIVCMALILFFLSAKSEPSNIYGFLELLAFSIITFESIALISNGRDYGKMREKIISETNKAMQKKSSNIK